MARHPSQVAHLAGETFARGLGLKSGADWKKFSRGMLPEKGHLPSDIPAKPDNTYADSGWSGMGDWLGTGRTRISKSPKRKS